MVATQPALQTAYHRHTGQPLGIVTGSDKKDIRGTKSGRPFVVARRYAMLRTATSTQVEAWAPSLVAALNTSAAS
jgi:hypothetical protein